MSSHAMAYPLMSLGLIPSTSDAPNFGLISIVSWVRRAHAAATSRLLIAVSSAYSVLIVGTAIPNSFAF